MLLTLHTLPQLAVSAKLLCLLMMVICGAVPSMVRSARLHNDCGHGYVRVDLRGRVGIGSGLDYDPFQNLTLRSRGFRKVTIQGAESSRFICFNKNWKLVGSKKFRGLMCEFYEYMTREHGGPFFQYQSVANSEHYMGFNGKGHPIKLTPDMSPKKLKCFDFQKDHGFNITEHNGKMSGNTPPSRQAEDSEDLQRALQPLDRRPKKVPGKKVATVNVRHNHGGSRNMHRKPS